MIQEQVDAILNKIVTGPISILADADLVVEEVAADVEIKKAVFHELDMICKPDCIFATNTSSLPIKAVGECLTRQMLGMHFFNPASVMKLVEVISSYKTPQTTVDYLMGDARKIGMTSVEVRGTPGFIVNCILIPMINEAISIYVRELLLLKKLIQL